MGRHAARHRAEERGPEPAAPVASHHDQIVRPRLPGLDDRLDRRPGQRLDLRVCRAGVDRDAPRLVEDPLRVGQRLAERA
jgi:hypothetical protein